MRTRLSSGRRGALIIAAIAAVAATILLGGSGTAALSRDDSIQFQLNQPPFHTGPQQFPYVNIAASKRGTVVRINVNTGDIVGEYSTNPDANAEADPNPSRTTVDQQGSVWVANRNESGLVAGVAKGSITRIGLIIGGTRVDKDGNPLANGQFLKGPFEHNTCVNRHGETVNDPPEPGDLTGENAGLIKTSMSGPNTDILPWPNGASEDTLGGVSTAEDECIINYTRVIGTGTRTLAIDANNDVWVGGYNNREHEQVNGAYPPAPDSGQPVPFTQFNLLCGGYGGLIDANGVLWSARGGANLLRYNISADTGQCLDNATHGDYGLGLDCLTGHIWHTSLYGNRVAELAPDGTLLSAYNHGNENAQGVAVDREGNVWVAHSLLGPSTTVGHLNTDGTLVGNVDLTPHGGSGPTGVSVDVNGNVWVANYYSDNAMRINPSLSAVGEVDMIVNLGAEASPYNYSDMTGLVAVCITEPPVLTCITIEKITDPPGGTGFMFPWAGLTDSGVVITAPIGFPLSHGESSQICPLEPGEYSFVESVPTGWLVTSIVCVGGSDITFLGSASSNFTPGDIGVTIPLSASQNVTCTFTNSTSPAVGGTVELRGDSPADSSASASARDYTAPIAAAIAAGALVLAAAGWYARRRWLR